MTEAARGFVGRAVGFGREETPFKAEITFKAADGGMATVREYGVTAMHAMACAKAAMAGKMTSRRRATGFTADGFRTAAGPSAGYIGFAAGVA